MSGCHRLQAGAEPGPLDRLAAVLGGGHHHAHHVGGNGKADALRTARTREDRSVDADQTAVEIDQCAAGIARIDGGVGLDEKLIVGDADLRARERRDDAVRHGLPDAERIAHREHHVADRQRIGVGKVERRKALVRILQPQHGEIAALVLEHDLGLELALVGERDLHFVGALDDVHVGDHEAGGVHDHAGAERTLQLAAAAALARHAEEAAEDRIVEQRVAVLHHLGGVDVDHRGGHALHHRRVGGTQFAQRRHPALLSLSLRLGGRGKDGERPAERQDETKPRIQGHFDSLRQVARI